MNTEHTNQSRQAEPFGWTDCEKDDEGAIALYDRPQAQPVARDVLMALARDVERELISGGYVAFSEQEMAGIVDRYATQPPAVAATDAEILAHFHGGKDQDAMNYSNLCDVVYQFTQSELLCAARAMLAATPQATAEDSSVVQADAPAPATEYSWSNNGEEYHGRFSSVAEAVCDYLDSEGDGAGEVVHVGEVKPHEPGNPIWLADNVLETLGEQAHGDVGEYVGDWPELPPEKREQLGKMIQDFVWTHDAPSFFSIGKSELVEVAAYRDDAAGQKGGA